MYYLKLTLRNNMSDSNYIYVVCGRYLLVKAARVEGDHAWPIQSRVIYARVTSRTDPPRYGASAVLARF